MPVYDVEHIHPLSDRQQDRLAEEITKIHSEKFDAPRLFVNVNFKNITNIRTYVAGKRVWICLPKAILVSRHLKLLKLRYRDQTIASLRMYDTDPAELN